MTHYSCLRGIKLLAGNPQELRKISSNVSRDLTSTSCN